jgi:hypothetical protein
MSVGLADRRLIEEFVLEELDALENAGDEFACLDDNDCDSPSGHLFKTSCGETKCRYCGLVVWS